MKTRAVVDRKNRLDAVFSRISNLPEESLQVRADFAAYLCVLTCGFLEAAASEIALEYCRDKSSPRIQNFVENRLQRPSNMNAEQLRQLVGSFDSGWGERIAEYLQGARKEAVDSLYANRNRIAHGDPVSLTFSRVQEYYGKVSEVVEYLEEIFS